MYKSCMNDAQRLAADSHYSLPAMEREWKDVAACDQQRDRNWQAAIPYHRDYAAIVSLVPIPLVWLAVSAVLALVRWIRAGFSRSVDARGTDGNR